MNYNWHHLVFLFWNDSLLIYHDGNLVGSDETPEIRTKESGDGKMVIGRHFTNTDEHYVSMYLDELMMWNEALDSNEINSLYNKNNDYSNEEIGNFPGLE